MSAAELLITGLPGLELDRESAAVLQRVQPGGVILFARNVEIAEQLAALTAAIRRVVPGVLLYSDSEGGRVDRLAAVVGRAPAGEALAAAPPALARRSGRWVGEALRLFGLDVDLAPVVDVDFGPRGNALDGRHLGATPRAVTARARAFLRGLHQAGVGGCLKHFPGLGRSTGDTHHGLGLVNASAAELAADLAPFQALHPVAGAVMVTHAIYPAFDADRPATLSPRLATALLRDELGFRGLTVADDLEMFALAPWGDLADRAEAALLAGCDLLPICRQIEALPAALERLTQPALAPRVAQARERLAVYRRHLASLPGASSSSRFSLATVRRVRRRIAGLC